MNAILFIATLLLACPAPEQEPVVLETEPVVEEPVSTVTEETPVTETETTTVE